MNISDFTTKTFIRPYILCVLVGDGETFTNGYWYDKINESLRYLFSAFNCTTELSSVEDCRTLMFGANIIRDLQNRKLKVGQKITVIALDRRDNSHTILREYYINTVGEVIEL